MNLQKELNNLSLQKHLPLLAKSIVEGFISGIHKSPFHGFSSEFSEHKIYNQGGSTRHIDWKRYAKTDRFYVKCYEEETNLRCHIIVDNSTSMHFPQVKNITLKNLNKIGFTVLSIAALMDLLKRQGDAVGLSVYSDIFEYFAPEKGSERHFRTLYKQLSYILEGKSESKSTKTYTYLHHIIEKIPRRSLIFLFTDMIQTETSKKKLFDALKHLKYNKHEVVLFHIYEKNLEKMLNYNNRPAKFTDIETQESLNIFVADAKKEYKAEVIKYFREIELECSRYKIGYVRADISKGVEYILNNYMRERQKVI